MYFLLSERQKQGHKDSTSDIYWDSWDTGKTREKSLSISASERSSRSSVTLDNDILLSSPSSDADTESSRLSTLSADTDGARSPKYSPHPYYFMKRSVSDDANLGRKGVFICKSYMYMYKDIHKIPKISPFPKKTKPTESQVQKSFR